MSAETSTEAVGAAEAISLGAAEGPVVGTAVVASAAGEGAVAVGDVGAGVPAEPPHAATTMATAMATGETRVASRPSGMGAKVAQEWPASAEVVPNLSTSRRRGRSKSRPTIPSDVRSVTGRCHGSYPRSATTPASATAPASDGWSRHGSSRWAAAGPRSAPRMPRSSRPRGSRGPRQRGGWRPRTGRGRPRRSAPGRMPASLRPPPRAVEVGRPEDDGPAVADPEDLVEASVDPRAASGAPVAGLTQSRSQASRTYARANLDPPTPDLLITRPLHSSPPTPTPHPGSPR